MQCSIRTLTCLFCLLFSVFGTVPGLTAAEVALDEAIFEELRRQEYRFRLTDSGALSAPNRAHDLRAFIHDDRFEVVSREQGAEAFRFGLRLTRFGREGAWIEAGEGLATFDERRAELARERIVEWWHNADSGLEHGFLLDTPPPGNPQLPVVLSMELDGTLMPYPDGRDAKAVVLRDANDTNVLRYSKLLVLDATGEELDARLEIGPRELRIVYDDRHAVYPVNVDPSIEDSDWIVTGPLNSGFATAVSTAGDVNGDGYSDVLVGSPSYDIGAFDQGQVSLYLGGPNGLSSTPDWTVTPNAGSSRLGEAVSTAGDVNDDGYDDILIAAPKFSNGQAFEGRVWVFHGSAVGISGTITDSDWKAEGNQANADFGSSVDFAGDVNGDGIHDIVIGARRFDGAATDGGKIFVYYGSSTGLSGSPDWEISSAAAGAEFGTAVAGAGDLDGDGYGDIAGGAPLFDDGGVDTGRVYLYHGSSSGPAYHNTLKNPYSTWCCGDPPGDFFGESLSTAGDVDGDGYADLTVGAPGVNDGDGAAFVFYGSSNGVNISTNTSWDELFYTPAIPGPNDPPEEYGHSVATAGDVNGDGYADIVAGTSWGYLVFYGQPFVAFQNLISTRYDLGSFDMSGGQVAPAGDVNGDGYADVIAGQPLHTDNGFLVGRAVALYGAQGFFWNDPHGTLTGGVDASWGFAAASAGDVNADGYDDVIVGEPLFDAGAGDEGRVLIYHGSRSGPSTTPDRIIQGSNAGGRYGSSVDGAGDVNGDGYDDVIVGAPGYTFNFTGQGAAFVHQGSSTGVAIGFTWLGLGSHAGSGFGTAVSGAGDVDGDGVSDFAVGEPLYNGTASEEGAVHVVLGDATLNFQSTKLTAGLPLARLGSSLDSAGDVNGDGYSDLIVGAPGEWVLATDTGRVMLYLGNSGGIDPTAAWMASGDQGGDNYGWSVAGAGDVDGDGFADLIVGAPHDSSGSSGAIFGSASVYRGSATASPTFLMIEENTSCCVTYGAMVDGLGDRNGDGYADVMVGNPGNDRAYVWQGGPAGMTVMNFLLDAFGDPQGRGWSAAGDVDGNGFADIVAGTRFWLGGDREGLDHSVRMQQPWGTSSPRIGLLGRSEDTDSVRLRSRARTPAGRDWVQVEYEVKPTHVPFDGNNTAFSNLLKTSSPISDGSRINFSSRVLNLTDGPNYHWRLRFLSPNPKFPRSRWRSPATTTPGDKMFITSCGVSTWYADVDADGFGDAAGTLDRCEQPAGYVAAPGDCNDQDASAWALPGAATDLVLSDDGTTTTLTWNAPGDLGGTPGGTMHRVVRSSSAASFSGLATCIFSSHSPQGQDTTIPVAGEVLFYLGVAENSCGIGSPGQDSGGLDRGTLVCP